MKVINICWFSKNILKMFPKYFSTFSDLFIIIKCFLHIFLVVLRPSFPYIYTQTFADFSKNILKFFQNHFFDFLHIWNRTGFLYMCWFFHNHRFFSSNFLAVLRLPFPYIYLPKLYQLIKMIHMWRHSKWKVQAIYMIVKQVINKNKCSLNLFLCFYSWKLI